MINWSAFNWDSFSTLFTGLVAFGGAVFLGARQLKISRRQIDIQHRLATDDLKLRQQTLRIELLGRRSDCVRKMRNVSSAWYQNANLTHDEWMELRSVLDDAQILYPDSVVGDIDVAVRELMTERLHAKRASEYRERGDEVHAQEQISKEFAASDKVFEVMPELLGKMIAHTRIFDWEEAT